MTEIFAFNGERHFASILHALRSAEEPPLLVRLSLAFQWRAKDFLALAVALREAGYVGHITCGGHFATFACAELLRDFPELDSICRQESELTVVALAQALVAASPLAAVAGLGLREPDGRVH